MRDMFAELRHVYHDLIAGQGMIARRNSRKRVKRALQRIEREMDKTFPLIRRKPKPRKPRTPEQRSKHLLKRGLIEISDAQVPRYVEVGLKIEYHDTGHYNRTPWVQKWAYLILNHFGYGDLQSAVRDKEYRDAKLALLALQTDGRRTTI